MKKNPYFTFIRFTNEGFIPDLKARELLNRIACAEDEQTPLTVAGVMSFTDIAAPATLHRKLEDLLIMKLVDHEYKNKNRRTKYVVLTETSRKYFELLGETMDRVVEASK